MKLTKIRSAAALAVALALAQRLGAGARAKRTVKLGVGGKPLLYYLPLTLAEQQGFFKEQGPQRRDQRFQGRRQSLQALVGGSVDVVTGAYEHTIRMQAKGQDILAVIELGRFPASRRGEEGPRRQDQVARRPQGHEDRRHRARLLHQHDR